MILRVRLGSGSLFGAERMTKAALFNGLSKHLVIHFANTVHISCKRIKQVLLALVSENGPEMIECCVELLSAWV